MKNKREIFEQLRFCALKKSGLQDRNADYTNSLVSQLELNLFFLFISPHKKKYIEFINSPDVKTGPVD